MKKLKNIKYKLSSISLISLIIIVWYIVTKFEIIPSFILPSPSSVIKAFTTDFLLISNHVLFTLSEAVIGLLLSIILGFTIAILMDRFNFINDALHPIIIISQTIPTIAIAPLIVLWFGFGILPKIILVFVTCFFPILMSILSGFKSIDKNFFNLLSSMDASYLQTLIKLKIPLSLNSFFSGLKISASYAIVGAVIAEWLGGNNGIGVYITRVRKSYSFDKMFAGIFVISILSILLIKIIEIIERRVLFWEE